MQLNRFMVNAFFEIKRGSPVEVREKLRISDPDIGEIVVALHQATDDPKIKLLARAFLMHAGGDWLKKLTPGKWSFREQSGTEQYPHI